MSRFAKVKPVKENVAADVNEAYLFGDSDKVNYVFRTKKGLDESVVREISSQKGEPEWMLERRLQALRLYESMPSPKWGGDLSEIRFDDIRYYLKPVKKY